MSGAIPVCVFAKPPVAGQAKTRLGRGSLGDAGAARLARAFLQDVWATVSALPWARPILAGSSDDRAAFGLPGEIELWPQGEGELGARMERVLARALAQAPQALLLGADLPGLPASHLDAALAELAGAEVVLGPSEDGGFYLLGARRLLRGALDGIGWSTATTRAQTLARLVETGHSVRLGLPWFDVDEPEDLPRLRARLRADPRSAPHTSAELAR